MGRLGFVGGSASLAGGKVVSGRRGVCSFTGQRVVTAQRRVKVRVQVKAKADVRCAAELEEDDESRRAGMLKLIGVVSAGLLVVCGISYGALSGGVSVERLREFSDWVVSLGATGQLVYGLLYTALEIVAVPALPLTVGCGYLFGPVAGTAIVSISSTTAAALSFLISRYALRDYMSRFVQRNSKFRAIDRAVAKEGLKFTLLLRLSPIFPFALSNYIYGLTSLRFMPYILGSWLGMLPGTIAYVSGGAAAEELTSAASGSGNTNYGLLALGAVATILTLQNLTRIANVSLEEEELSGEEG